MQSSKKGIWGENKAGRFLESKGYRILDRRYRSKRSEWDLICTKEDLLVFVEVKAWDCFEEDSLCYSLTKKRIQRMRDLARRFIMENPQWEDRYIRFDIVFLSRRTGELNHIEEAFQGEGAPYG